MADFEICFRWSMQFEDPTLACEPVPDACPEGCQAPHCFAVSGINSGEFPGEYAAIMEWPVAHRLAFVRLFYRAHFWSDPLAQIVSTDVAKRVYDAGVNEGPVEAIITLQAALNTLGATLTKDGVLGPLTLAAANHADTALLVSAFQQARLEFLKRLPGWDTYGKGWEARALA